MTWKVNRPFASFSYPMSLFQYKEYVYLSFSLMSSRAYK